MNQMQLSLESPLVFTRTVGECTHSLYSGRVYSTSALWINVQSVQWVNVQLVQWVSE